MITQEVQVEERAGCTGLKLVAHEHHDETRGTEFSRAAENEYSVLTLSGRRDNPML